MQLDLSVEKNLEALEQGVELFSIPYDMAAVHAVRGQCDQSMEWLERTIESGFRLFRIATTDPVLENIRAYLETGLPTRLLNPDAAGRRPPATV